MHKQLLYSAHNLTNGGACDNDSLGEHLGLLTAVIVEDRIRHDNQCPLRSKEGMENVKASDKIAAAVAIAQAYRPWVWPASLRAAITAIYDNWEPLAAVHDVDFNLSDGTRKGWTPEIRYGNALERAAFNAGAYPAAFRLDY